MNGAKNALDLANDMHKGDASAGTARCLVRHDGRRQLHWNAMSGHADGVRRGLAEILAGFKEPAVNRQLVNEIGKGRTHEKLFVLWAVRGIEDEKIDKALQKMLQDKDPEVVMATCKTLADRKDATAVPALQKLVEKGKDRRIIRARSTRSPSSAPASPPGLTSS